MTGQITPEQVESWSLQLRGIAGDFERLPNSAIRVDLQTLAMELHNAAFDVQHAGRDWAAAL